MKIDLYGSTICPNCHNVAEWINENGLTYNYKLVPEDISPLALADIVGRVVRSVPVIVVDGKEKTFQELKDDVSKMATLDDLDLSDLDL